VRQREDGLPKRLVGFRTEGRAIPRHGYRLRAGESTGVVTSGNFSPVLQCGIGMGFLSPPSDDAPIEVEIRNRWIPAERTNPPFVNED
jgi:aminomethyltransferase